MRINCPQCGFFRDLPDTKAPVTPTMATCPKCRHRFRFRPEPTPANPAGQIPPGEEGVSSWRRPSPAKLDRQKPPATTWEPGEGPDADARPQETEAPDSPSEGTDQDRAPAAAPELVSWPSPQAPQDTADAPPQDEDSQPPSHWAQPVEPEEPPTLRRQLDAEPPLRARPRKSAPAAPAEPVAPQTTDDVAPPSPRQASRAPTPQAAPPTPRPEISDIEADDDATPAIAAKAAPETPDPRPEPNRDAPVPPPVAAARPDPAPADTVPAAPHLPPPAESAAEPSVESPSKSVETPGPAPRPDGVRDIWARLQAMDEHRTQKRRAEHQRPVEDEPDAPPRETVVDPIPWERQDAYGFFPGLFLTLKKILLHPMDFFGSLPEGRPKTKALVFSLLISEFLLVIDFLWSLTNMRLHVGSPAQQDALKAMGNSPSLSFLAALLLVPLALSIGIYLDAWFTHLLLRLFRSTTKGFNETFRVLCYSAAPTAFSAVPVIGQLLSPVILIWYMALQAIGLKKCHEGAYTQTLAAIFIKWSIYLFLTLAVLQSITPGQ